MRSDENICLSASIGQRLCVYVVYVEILSNKSASSTTASLKRLIEKAPIIKLLTDNGKAFTDRFCATGERKPTNHHHPFDKVCVQENIEHRLISPRKPQTNGMVERLRDLIRVESLMY